MNNIKKIRKERSIKQSELAKILGVDQGTLSRFENGDRRIDSDTLLKLSKYLDLSIDYILGNTDIPMTLDQVRFDNEVDDLTDDEVFDQYELYLHGEKLTKDEAKKMLELIRALNKK